MPLRCVATYTLAIPPTPISRSSLHLPRSTLPTRAWYRKTSSWFSMGAQHHEMSPMRVCQGAERLPFARARALNQGRRRESFLRDRQTDRALSRRDRLRRLERAYGVLPRGFPGGIRDRAALGLVATERRQAE